MFCKWRGIDIDMLFYRLRIYTVQEVKWHLQGYTRSEQKLEKNKASYFLFLCKDQTLPHRGRGAKRHSSYNKTKIRQNRMRESCFKNSKQLSFLNSLP